MLQLSLEPTTCCEQSELCSLKGTLNFQECTQRTGLTFNKGYKKKDVKGSGTSDVGSAAVCYINLRAHRELDFSM
jgi:hypothetical protein